MDRPLKGKVSVGQLADKFRHAQQALLHYFRSCYLEAVEAIL
jgi:hypothetical protein